MNFNKKEKLYYTLLTVSIMEFIMAFYNLYFHHDYFLDDAFILAMIEFIPAFFVGLISEWFFVSKTAKKIAQYLHQHHLSDYNIVLINEIFIAIGMVIIISLFGIVYHGGGNFIRNFINNAVVGIPLFTIVVSPMSMEIVEVLINKYAFDKQTKLNIIDSLGGESLLIYEFLPELLKGVDHLSSNSQDIISLIEKHVSGIDRCNILDLGCGKGDILRYFAFHYGSYGIGEDFIKEFIVEANTNALKEGIERHIKFRVANIDNTIDHHGFYDIVIYSQVGTTEKVFSHLKHLIKHNGYLVIDCQNNIDSLIQKHQLEIIDCLYQDELIVDIEKNKKELIQKYPNKKEIIQAYECRFKPTTTYLLKRK